jgi:hypothetical protein
MFNQEFQELSCDLENLKLDIKNRQAEKGYILFAFRAESV